MRCTRSRENGSMRRDASPAPSRFIYAVAWVAGGNTLLTSQHRFLLGFA
jgi:hypothetical protein